MGGNSRYGFLLLLSVLLAAGAQAQFRLPPFDAEVKISQSLIPNNDNGNTSYNLDLVEATCAYGAAHLQVSQHIAVGWLYAQSFRGSVKYSSNGSGTAPASEKASMLMYGPDVRFTTSRAKNTRFSLSVNYTQLEFVDEKEGYRLAHKTNTLGASFGIVKRLSNTLDLNIIELGGRLMLGEKAFWLDSNVVLEAKTGITFNFSKRK